MQNGDTYRHLAKGCEEKAREEHKVEYRLGWETLAQSCRILADQAEHAGRQTQGKPVSTIKE